MFGIGFPEGVVIVGVILLLFGPEALPEIARGLARGVKLFQNELRDLKEAVEINSHQILASSDENDFKPQRDISNDYNPEVSKRDWRPKSVENNSQGGV